MPINLLLKGARILPVLISVSIFSCKDGEKKHWDVDTENGKARVETVTEDIAIPFGMNFLPDGRMLVTDRPAGKLISLDVNTGEKTEIRGVPAVDNEAEESILDIVPDPDFSKNNAVFLAFASKTERGSTLAVERFTLKGDQLSDPKRIFTAVPYFKKYNFFGCRLVVNGGFVFITTGVSKAYLDSAQRMTNHQGKIMRVREDGTIPEDNPFVKTPGALPEIWCLGVRNPQGLAINPVTQELWENEHGPKGGDEVNIIQPGKNYGWPVISYGVDYDDKPIGEGLTHREGMEQPVHQYTPSIAPSGMLFYTGDAFPRWKGNIFIGAMKLKHLNRLEIKDNKVIHEERLLKELDGRIRNVIQGPDGFLYVGVDGGMIVRIKPN